MKTRLSSDLLFHFTSTIDKLKLILQNGFRHSLISEPRPSSPIIGKEFMQQNYLVCFCDIKPDENAFHRQCYGSFALAMSKQWGIRNKISPVQYVHPNTIGLEQEFIELRTFTKGLFDYEHKFEGVPDFKDRIAKNILAWSIWMDQRHINTDIIEMHTDRLYDELIEILRDKNKEEPFKLFILKLRQRIADLHHYLELRDPFQRNYKEDFYCPNSGQIIKGKVLYDEREWRSCNTTHLPEDVVAIESDNSIVLKGYLTEKHNLQFIDEDLIEIKLNSVKFKDDLFNFLKINSTKLDIDLTMDKVSFYE